MPDGKAARRRLPWKIERHLEPQWLEHQLAHGGFERLAGDHLDDAAGDLEARVVVSPHHTRGRMLLHIPQRLHPACQRIVAPAPVDLDAGVAVPADRVRDQVMELDLASYILVLDPEVRQVTHDRIVERQLALLHQQHQCRGGKGLAGRADVEERRVGNRQRVIDAGHAGGDEVLFPVDQHTDGNSRHLAPGASSGNFRLELRFDRHDLTSLAVFVEDLSLDAEGREVSVGSAQREGDRLRVTETRELEVHVALADRNLAPKPELAIETAE